MTETPFPGTPPFVSDPVPGNTLREDVSWLNRILLAFLGLIAVWSFLWPAYRAFLNIEIDMNEGWNAYLADAAVRGSMPLYPSPDSLVTNNYPPLSFYIVGAVGEVTGDPLLAGRLLSLASVIAIGIAIGLCVRRLGGTPFGAATGGLLFVATMSRFFTRYVGMDDPQLLAQAVMAFAFAGFISAWNRDRGYLVPILFMVVAGFIKHNIITLPAAAFLWLVVHRPREALKCYSIAFLAIVLGFFVCRVLYGRDFLLDMLTPRNGSGIPFLIALAPLARIDAALAASLALVCFRPRDSRIRLIGLVVLMGIAVYFLQKRCRGVDINAIFDLLIGVSIATGLAISLAPPLPRSAARFVGTNALASVILLVIGLRLLPTSHVERLKAVRLFFDPSLKTEIALREKAMADCVARVRATSGPVLCTTFVCYRSGKPLAVDRFNVDQRIAAGALPRNVLKSRIRVGALTDVYPDPLTDWDKGLESPSP